MTYFRTIAITSELAREQRRASSRASPPLNKLIRALSRNRWQLAINSHVRFPDFQPKWIGARVVTVCIFWFSVSSCNSAELMKLTHAGRRVAQGLQLAGRAVGALHVALHISGYVHATLVR